MRWLSLANLQHAYARLAPRERLFVATGGAVFAAFVVFLIVYKAHAVKSSLRARIVAKQHQLEQVELSRSAFLELKRQTDALTSKGAGPNGLYATLDGIVTKKLSRDKVSSMAPSSPKTIGDQYVEEVVNVQLVGITLQQTVELLYELEQSSTPLHVSRLQMKKRPADPYQFDVTFAVSSVSTKTSS
jgi:type II secretory pathway component PulM